MTSQPKNLNDDVKNVLLNNSSNNMNSFDQNLINPYSHIINRKHKTKTSGNNLFESLPEYQDKLPFIKIKSIKNSENNNQTKNETVNPKVESENGIDIFNKFDDINNIIKNETIKTLKTIHHFGDDNNSTTENNNVNNKTATANVVNLGTFSPFDMLKFKENNSAKRIKNFVVLRDIKDIQKENHKKHLKKRYESTRKMFENIDHQQKYESKLNHNAKLFLNHFKENIDKIDDIVNKE